MHEKISLCATGFALTLEASLLLFFLLIVPLRLLASGESEKTLTQSEVPVFLQKLLAEQRRGHPLRATFSLENGETVTGTVKAAEESEIHVRESRKLSGPTLLNTTVHVKSVKSIEFISPKQKRRQWNIAGVLGSIGLFAGTLGGISSADDNRLTLYMLGGAVAGFFGGYYAARPQNQIVLVEETNRGSTARSDIGELPYASRLSVSEVQLVRSRSLPLYLR